MDAMQTLETKANQLAALGQPGRLSLFRLLVQAGEPGLKVGELQELSGIGGSTLTHHLNVLSQAALIQREKQGRAIVCRARFAQMHALMDYLNENCCCGYAAQPLPATHVVQIGRPSR